MKFSSAQRIESLVWDLKLADLPRADNRARVMNLFNGLPPYSDEYIRANNLEVAVNFLEAPQLAQAARTQYETAFFTPAYYFSVKVDRGPAHKREEWSTIITRHLSRAMKQGASALKYRENLRNVFASTVLFGVGPVTWDDRESWCPEMSSIADVMIPSQTLLTMGNLEYFATYRRYTAAQLHKMTHGPKVDKAWNLDIADKCMEWAGRQTGQNTIGAETWTPERIAEDVKENGGWWGSDAVPTINCWDFRYFDDASKVSGWKRKIVLDAPSLSEAGDYKDKKVSATTKNFLNERNQFLYDGEDRNFASKLSEMTHWQFADGSITAPFRYHSVRSLGYLLYAVCHLQNRLRCAMTEAAFEACLQYFRVSNPNDAQRVIKLALINRGVIPDGVNFVRPEERWQVNERLIQTVMGLNRQSMADNSASYNRNFGLESEKGPEKTATQINAEVNAASAMTSAMLESSYGYQIFQYREIARRFCIANSKDPDVRQFRMNCIEDGIPVEALNSDCWDLTVEKVLGSGNRQVAFGQAQAMMQVYDRLEPSGQQVVLRNYVFAVTGDSGLTDSIVPAKPQLVTNSVHDAQLSASTLLMGLPMGLKEGVSHAEYAATLLGSLGVEVQKASANGGMADMTAIQGMMNLAGQSVDGQPMANPDGSPGNGALFHIQILEQDNGAKQLVKQLNDILSNLMNEVRALAQRAMEAMQAQQNGNGQPELTPEDTVKLKSELTKMQIKSEAMRDSHNQRMEQRQQIHQFDMEKSAANQALESENKIRATETDVSAKDLETAAKIQRDAAQPKALTE